ncbi:DUF2591 domain-containing protein [Enterobacteriaceae bacterium ML5]|nr:DUF2591 domain-containing protein [Enterobacteriaceae bacterium ML5]
MTDYTTLTDYELNCEVAKKLRVTSENNKPCQDWFKGPAILVWGSGSSAVKIDYCNNAFDAWPVIVKNSISIINSGSVWTAAAKGVGHEGVLGDSETCWYAGANTYDDVNPLKAAMIVFLKMEK